ncbi:pantoate--beta-alanine ligase [Roseivirga misakiensis]|uniref:Pantothenate synthetase n=1 Tax=Roseivirga misakiensis TaxID=1563681 RepID=A0A1E5T3E9_9BACT|nr:pantoate--beta-alanine ligase [Roseivirga misakiensis]OEK05913.1 pantoate--beta-alanine ligase [Roseivirga misakiensis]
MKVFQTIVQIREKVQSFRAQGRTIGFVPTMGALHQGHLALVQSSKQNCDITIASIFVNPTQFNNPEDLENYPRTSSSDIEKLEGVSCDFLFMPSKEEMYPHENSIKIQLGSIANQLEGKFRPGHFDGVGVVVSKLFNIVQPDQAFFGQKDLQQFFIIKKLIDEVNFPITLNMVPTVREANGLAMSSRNLRLNSDQTEDASLIYKSLLKAQKMLLSHTPILEVKAKIEELFSTQRCLELEYFEVINTDNFESVNDVVEKEKIAMCIAAEIGRVRLIDNLMLIS